MYQLADGGSASTDAQAITATLVTVPVIHNPRGRSNTTPGGNDNHKDTAYDKMNVIVNAAAFAAAKEKQGGQQECQQGREEECHLETPPAISSSSSSFVASPSSSSHGVPKTKFDIMCDVASAHRAMAIPVKAKITSTRPQKLKPKSSLFSPMRMETPDMRDFSSSQASEFVPTVVHTPVVYYPNNVTQHETSAMTSSPPGLHLHTHAQQAAKVSGPRQPSTTPHPQLVPTFMPMPAMMMMPQQHSMTMMAAPVTMPPAPGFVLPTQQQPQQQTMMPILSAYPPMMFPPVQWLPVPTAAAACGQESLPQQLQSQMMAHQASPMNHPSYQHAVLRMSHPIQVQQQSLQSFPAACSAFTSKSPALHVVGSRKSSARPKTTSPPRKSSPSETGSSEKKTRLTPPTIVHQPNESCHIKPKQQIKKTN